MAERRRPSALRFTVIFMCAPHVLGSLASDLELLADMSDTLNSQATSQGLTVPVDGSRIY